MSIARLVLVLSVISLASTSAQASLIQRFEFFLGGDLSVDPVATLRVLFPASSGCVSGPPVGVFLGWDCNNPPTTGIGDTNVPEDIFILTDAGRSDFYAGYWFIDVDSGLLENFGFNFGANLIPGAVAGNFTDGIPLPFPTETNPTAVLGEWGAVITSEGQPVGIGGLAIATPVPSPAVSTLLCIGMAGVMFGRRRPRQAG